MIRQETTSELIDRVSNMDGVRSGICYHDRAMEWKDAFPSQRSGIVVLSNGEDAVSVFVATGKRHWQAHTLFAPSCRGRDALRTGAAMLAWMQPHADAVWGATPIRNCAARWFNRQLGAMPIRRDHFEAEGEVEIFVIRMADAPWSHLS